MKKNSINIIFNCYKLVFFSSPFLSICEAFSYFGAAIISGLKPLILKQMFDGIEMFMLNKSNHTLINSLLWFSIFQTLEVFFRLLGRISTRVFGYKEKVIFSLRKKLYEHACMIPLISFENIDNYEAFERANYAIGKNAAVKVVDYIYQTPAMVLSFLITTISLWIINPILVFFAIFAIVPISVLYISKSYKFYQLKKTQSSFRIKKQYFWSLFLSAATIKDIKVFQAEDFFRQKWLYNCNRLNQEDKELFFKFSKNQIKPLLFKIIGNGIGVITTAFLFFYKKISIGSFSAAISTFQNLQGDCIQIIMNIQDFRESYMFFGDYLDFLEIPIDNTGNSQLKTSFCVELKDVSFSYPNCHQKVLTNISIKIKENEHIAIVGDNGSGKTTLCRIIMGLYAPTSGEIKYDNHYINDYDLRYKKLISAVFQDYQKYLFDVRSNVAFGDIDCFYDNAQIFSALQKVDAKHFNVELDSQLGSHFDGIELSEGQWQHLAVARCYMSKSAKLMILDEPTAAIDPIRESELFKSFIRNTTNCSSIIITHRIGSAKLADRIVVLDSGKICEMGSHDELMQLNGKYAKMYNEQSKWYL